MAGRLLPLMALLAVTVTYAHRLTLQDYGIFQSVWMYSNLVSVVLGFGVTTIIFATYAETFFTFIKQHKKEVFGFYTLLWILAIAAFWIVSPYNHVLKILVVAFILFQNMNSISESWLIKNMGDKIYLLVNIAYSALFFLWHYYILQHGYVLEDVMTGIAVLSVLKFASLTFLMRMPASGNPEAVNTHSFLSNWGFTGINDVISIISKWIDKLILIYLLTPSEFAIFFNGSIEIPAIGIILGMTGGYMMMQMTRSTPQKEWVATVFKENYHLLSSIIFPLFFFLLFFRQDVFVVFFGEKYLPSIPIFVITILILPFRINHFGTILQVYAKGNIITRGAVLDLILATALIFSLYPVWGMKGAAAAGVISTVIQLGYYLYQSAKVLNVSVGHLLPDAKLFVRFVIVGGLFFVCSSLLREQSSLLSFIVGLSFTGCLVLLLGRRYIIQIFKERQKA